MQRKQWLNYWLNRKFKIITWSRVTSDVSQLFWFKPEVPIEHGTRLFKRFPIWLSHVTTSNRCIFDHDSWTMSHGPWPNWIGVDLKCVFRCPRCSMTSSLLLIQMIISKIKELCLFYKWWLHSLWAIDYGSFESVHKTYCQNKFIAFEWAIEHFSRWSVVLGICGTFWTT